MHLSGSCWNKRTRGKTGRKGNKGESCTCTHNICTHTHTHIYKRVVSVLLYRETQVQLVPRVKQALWVPRECQENLELKALEGCQDQWLVNSPSSMFPNAPESQHLLGFSLFQGEQGSPGPAGQKGPPGPIVSWHCLHVFICRFYSSPWSFVLLLTLPSASPSAGTSRFAWSAWRVRRQRRKRTPRSYWSDWTPRRAGREGRQRYAWAPWLQWTQRRDRKWDFSRLCYVGAALSLLFSLTLVVNVSL